jgi:ribosomal protein S27AE
MREVVHLEAGTMADEKVMKRTGTCPKCGEPLADSLVGIGR